MKKEIHIFGRVQGVGFRPFIFNLAQRFHLQGTVSNDGVGVFIQIKGAENDVENFIRQIPLECPTNAIIESIQVNDASEFFNAEDFKIIFSNVNKKIDLPLTPDFALCSACAAEMLDKNNRRYFYPFTTCTHCGPRYAVTRRFPFERENTALAGFPMCPDCQKEYTSPENRRFHSQTNTCARCGIHIQLKSRNGAVFEGDNETVFKKMAALLAEGKILALKNIAGYLLLCDAANAAAVQELRKRKRRPYKPFAVLFHNIASVEKYLSVKEIERNALCSSVAPIVLLPIKQINDLAKNEIAPGLNNIGAMLPNSGMLFLLSYVFQKPLIATSGNLHGSPLCANAADAELHLRDIADYFLHHDLPVLHPQDDSVMRFSRETNTPVLLRRGRGLAPNAPAVRLSADEKILCLGGDLKSTISFLPNHYCYNSEYLGDLSNYDTYLRYQKTVNSYCEIFACKPQIIIHDAHPQYENRQILDEFPYAKKIAVLHHQAHFAAILGEHKLWNNEHPIMGVVWDGTGYGAPNEIHGGEFFIYHQKKIKRVAHLENYAWILADKMAQTPKIAALAASGGDERLRNYFTDTEWKLYTRLIAQEKTRTSSMGRIFDATAFLLGFRRENSFEGEAAMYLETLAEDFHQQNPNVQGKDFLENENIIDVVPVKKLIRQMIATAEMPDKWAATAFHFHYTLVKCIEKVAQHQHCRHLAFSGGVFQNALLVDLLVRHLSKDFHLYFHRQLSPNDENISFGQLNYWLNIQ